MHRHWKTPTPAPERKLHVADDRSSRSEATRTTWARGSSIGVSLIACLMLMGCGRGSTPVRVATANSYLESAALEFLDNPGHLTRLAEPGTCPGHFDIRPSQVLELRSCRLLLRFDFQRGLDERLTPLAAKGLRIGIISPPPGLGIPGTYLETCRQTARQLVASELLPDSTAEEGIRLIESRLAVLAGSLREQAVQAGLKGMPALSSPRQQGFCEWVGLRVVGTFAGADQLRPSELERLLTVAAGEGVSLVVANRPEGRQVADALADRLHARVAVLENFPLPSHLASGFDAMVRSNMAVLATGGH